MNFDRDSVSDEEAYRLAGIFALNLGSRIK
jgi:hypothetical protein